MNIVDPIFWHQGLFLQPQHFQTIDRNTKNFFSTSISLSNQYAWGIDYYKIDLDALTRGFISILELEALFQDGSVIFIPQNAICSDRSFSKAWMDKEKPFRIFIGVKNIQGRENVAVISSDDLIEKFDNRFICSQETIMQKDLYADGAPDASIKKMSYLIKIFFASEIDKSVGYSIIPLLELVMQKNEITISEAFSYPVFNIGSSKTLYRILEHIKDSLYSRTRQLQEFKSPKSLKEANMNTNYFFYMFALQTINKFLPIIKIYYENKKTHPHNLYIVLAQLIGELSMFTDRIDALGRLKNGNELLLAYDHSNLYDTLASAKILIQELLESLVIGPEFLISFERTDDIFICKIESDVFMSGNSYYLVVKSDDSYEKVFNDFQEINKIGSQETIRTLIDRALPGIEVSLVDSQPLGLPKKDDLKYLKLNTSSALWLDVKRYQNLSIYYDNATIGTEIQLAVIKG